MKTNQAIPVLDKAGDLGRVLHGSTDDGEDWLEDNESGHAPSAAPAQAEAGIERILGEKSAQERLDLLADLSRRFPEVRQRILEVEQLASGQVDELVRTLREEIDDLTAEPAWYNHWRGEGQQPDYSHLNEQLQALVDQGHADAALQLGDELWTRGNAQVEESNHSMPRRRSGRLLLLHKAGRYAPGGRPTGQGPPLVHSRLRAII